MIPIANRNKNEVSSPITLVLMAAMVVGLISCGGGGGSSAPVTVDAGGESLVVVDKLALGYHSCAGFDDGSIKCWGLGDGGAPLGLEKELTNLGDEPGEMGENLSALNLGTGLTIVQVATGSGFNCARMSTGQVKCWGNNDSNQLGNSRFAIAGDEPGELGDQLPFVDLGTGKTAKSIAAGWSHACAILNDNTVKCWGSNATGELGLGDTQTRGDQPDEMGDALPIVDLGTARTALSIIAGSRFNCALLDNNSVKCWGYNQSGQLGQSHSNSIGTNSNQMGDNLTAINLGSGRSAQLIKASGNHVCAVLDNNTVKCWGNNTSGKLGLGDTNPRGDDINEMGDNLAVVELGTNRTAVSLALAQYHSCALLDDNSVKCWGGNDGGKLGVESTLAIGDNAGEMGDNLAAADLGAGRTAQSISAGFHHSCALLDNSNLKCWGYNYAGELGQGHTVPLGDNINEMGDNLPAIDLGTGRTVLAIESTNSHNCALLDNNALKCWGENWSGQLGTGDALTPGDEPDEMGLKLPFVSVGTGRSVKVIAAGEGHTCVILDTNDTKCWGFNSQGQLGLGHTNTIGGKAGDMGDNLQTVNLGTGRSAKSISVGSAHTCAVLDNDSVKCWGDNWSGRLGLGDDVTRGDNAGEMGDNLLAVNLGTGRTARAVTAGDNHSCALLDDNSVKCWGYNRSGQLGLGDMINRGQQSIGMGDDLPSVNLGAGRSAKIIEASSNFTCAVLDDNSLKCWGDNSNGRLGQGDSLGRGDNANEMSDVLLPVDLGTDRTVKSLAVGTRHVCVLLDNDSVKCWGSNYGGESGLGELSSRGSNSTDMGNNLLAIDLGTGKTAKLIQAGDSHTCAILNDDTLKCWGDNYGGALGLGNIENKGDEQGEMGDNLPVVNLLY